MGSVFFGGHPVPRKPEEISFDKTIKTSRISNKHDSLFHMRYKCLNIIKQENEDFTSYDSMVNSQCELLKINEIQRIFSIVEFSCKG